MQLLSTRFDAVVVGGGHNGLTAAAYLAQAGRHVLVVEQSPRLGGAAVSEQVFPGVPARLSRYSYLVSLLPRQIVDELGLQVVLRHRPVSSYSARPDGPGLLVSGQDPHATERSFEQVTGGRTELAAWRDFYQGLQRMAARIFPTFLQPLASRGELRRLVADEEVWRAVFTEPLGFALESRFRDDLVRGLALTDGLIGTLAAANDPSLTQNRCFLYHTVGRGTGDWLVPVGGMGTVTDELFRVARAAGAKFATRVRVTDINPGSARHPATLRLADEDGNRTTVAAGHVLLAGACPDLHERLGHNPYRAVEGAQVKVNLVLRRLPRFRVDVDPALAYGGTLHINQSATQLQQAYQEAAAGVLPTVVPVEAYCHSLTDPSILGPHLRTDGVHTLTLFALHLPHRLFTADNEATRALALRRILDSVNSVLAEPVEDCLLSDAQGRPCIDAATPVDLENRLGLPGGNIFHRPLQWPFAENPLEEGLWGVETDHTRVLLAGAGARRGGGVSGIAGRNAAMAVLEAG